MPPIAKHVTNTTYLSSEFGYQLAVKWFGQEAVDSLPVYTKRSKYAGSPKGKITWTKCVSGGWVPALCHFHGYVEKQRGAILAKVLSIPQWNKPDIYVQSWSALGKGGQCRTFLITAQMIKPE